MPCYSRNYVQFLVSMVIMGCGSIAGPQILLRPGMLVRQPPPGNRRAGLPLLPCPRGPAADQDEAHPGSRPAHAGSTSAHGKNGTMPWPASKVRLLYQPGRVTKKPEHATLS